MVRLVDGGNPGVVYYYPLGVNGNYGKPCSCYYGYYTFGVIGILESQVLAIVATQWRIRELRSLLLRLLSFWCNWEFWEPRFLLLLSCWELRKLWCLLLLPIWCSWELWESMLLLLLTLILIKTSILTCFVESAISFKLRKLLLSLVLIKLISTLSLILLLCVIWFDAILFIKRCEWIFFCLFFLLLFFLK